MKTRSLLILTLLVVVLGLFIGVWERHQPTTDEARKLADKLFPSLEAKDIHALVISGPRGEFHFAREKGTWELNSPIEAKADQNAIDSLLRSLLGLKITRKLEGEDLDSAKYGLDKTEYRLTLHEEKGAEKHLEIGSKMPLGSERALRLDEGPIVLADAFFSSQLNKDLNAWRSHELISLSLYDLAAIEIKEQDARIEALKIGKKWRLKSPVDDVADEEHLSNLISGLNGVKILDFVDENPEPAAMGLEDPRYALQLIPSDGSPAIRLDFGLRRDLQGTKQIACRRGEKEYFWVDTLAENALGKAPILWRETRICPFQSWDAQSIEISAGEQKFSAHRDAGVWTLESGTNADASKIEARLSMIAGIRAKGFDLIETGQAKLGEIRIALSAPGSEKTEDLSITLYRAMEKGSDVLLKVSGRDKLMSIAAQDADKMLGKLDKLAVPEPTPGPQEGDEPSTKPE